ncbi:hypothetical protein [Haliangium ochraceum]|uniref:Uncharacterized protein n=1 Tax=Haliangium ochraceum (strain DSM 14365 / JCM 11303 / SMP-2) TaxID=502025 RepID=D0LGB4_HALO1|nr:hypothetical protein [Haliangium ochraceum]ACY18139.1 hypothetical protein Hoch_5662 [Haliangium ochraceum DSM 14365]
MSKEDKLLAELGQFARQQEALAAPGDEDEAELLRPLEDDARERIAARLLAQLGQSAAAATAPAASAAGDARESPAAPEPAAASTPGDVIPLRPRRRRQVAVTAAAAVLAAAAALLLVVGPRDRGPQSPALAVYSLELGGGRALERGRPETEVLRVAPGDAAVAVLRPATPVSGAVAVRVFADGRALPPLASELSADGVIRVSGLGAAVAELAPGAHTLLFAIARPEALVELPETLDADAASDAVPAGVQLLAQPIERLPPR